VFLCKKECHLNTICFIVVIFVLFFSIGLLSFVFSSPNIEKTNIVKIKSRTAFKLKSRLLVSILVSVSIPYSVQCEF